MKTNKFVNFFKKHCTAIVAVIASIFWVFNGAIKIIPSGASITEIFAFVSLSFVAGILISSMVADSGYTAALSSEEFMATRNVVLEWSDKVLPWKKEAELYVDKKIDKEIKSQRVEILSKASINYNEIFNEDNVPYTIKSLKARKEYSRKQFRAIKRAIKIKKVSFELFGYTTAKVIGLKEAPSVSKRRKNKALTALLSKAIVAILLGSIMFKYVGITVDSLIYAFCQTIIWIGGGMFQRRGNYNFIINDVRDYDKEKTGLLKEFDSLTQEEKEKLRVEVSVKEAQNEGVKRLTYNPEIKEEKLNGEQKN